MRNFRWKSAVFRQNIPRKYLPLCKLYQFFWTSRAYRLGLLNVQPLHEPGELLPGQRLYLLGIPWPLVTAIVQSLVQQHKPVRFSQQSLQPVTPFATKQKQTAGIGVYPKVLLHEWHQTVQALTHIGIAADNVDLLGLTDISQHLSSAPHQARQIVCRCILGKANVDIASTDLNAFFVNRRLSLCHRMKVE